jgi:mRNA interferase RelE/StbE
MTSERYEVKFQPAARRAIAERLPESVAAAVLEFCEAALALSPGRVGKPLFGPLAGCHGARRGTYRVVYRIDEQARVVEALDIDHRADIYHRSLGQSGDRSEPARRCAVASPREDRHPVHGIDSVRALDPRGVLGPQVVVALQQRAA